MTREFQVMDRRQFLSVAAASSALAVAPIAVARVLLSGEAVRRSPEAVSLRWTGGRGPASIWVSSDPDAGLRAMRLLQQGVRDDRSEARAPVSPRPYFLLRTADGGQLRLAERLLPLQGGRNFRDLGGYRAADGRQVRWGRIYRSGVMSGLTPADMAYLGQLGIRVICDLRSIQERRAQPNPFIGHAGPQVVSTDYEMMSFAAMGRVRTRAEALQAFAEAYVEFTRTLAPQYADMFARLARDEAPLAVNCSAGKDRTGMASALILSVLGVPRQTVVADYGLTQVYTPAVLDPHAGGGNLGLPAAQLQALASAPAEVRAVMGGSDPEVMQTTLDLIDARFGGPVALAKSHLGLTDRTIARLRRLYLV
jgi:protein-tyrosine phosphatase